MEFREFLETSYTAWQAVENAAAMLDGQGFCELFERAPWELKEGGKYYVRRGAALIAFRYGTGAFKIVAAHTDSPCLKLKENALLSDGLYARLNTEPYGGGLWYTFFDRPLRIAGRIIEEVDGKLLSRSYVSPFRVILPSLAIHQNRDANDKFAPNLQTELPLLALGKGIPVAEGAISYDLYAAVDQPPFESGPNGELLSSPRLDDLTGVYAALTALTEAADPVGTVVAACLNAEEIGSRTFDGAGSDLLLTVLCRILEGRTQTEQACTYASSLLVSMDNAHALHPNHPEKCDPTNRPAMGQGIVIKGHAGGAYTTDGMTSAILKTVFSRAGVKFQSFFNRSDARSGSTLGAISLSQISIPSVDIGLAQLAMHSAVETVAESDVEELLRGLTAFYQCDLTLERDTAIVE